MTQHYFTVASVALLISIGVFVYSNYTFTKFDNSKPLSLRILKEEETDSILIMSCYHLVTVLFCMIAKYR